MVKEIVLTLGIIVILSIVVLIVLLILIFKKENKTFENKQEEISIKDNKPKVEKKKEIKKKKIVEEVDDEEIDDDEIEEEPEDVEKSKKRSHVLTGIIIFLVLAILFYIFVPLDVQTVEQPLSYVVISENDCIKDGYGLFTNVYVKYGITLQNTDSVSGFFRVVMNTIHGNGGTTKTENIKLEPNQRGDVEIKDYSIRALDSVDRCSYTVYPPTKTITNRQSLFQKLNR